MRIRALLGLLLIDVVGMKCDATNKPKTVPCPISMRRELDVCLMADGWASDMRRTEHMHKLEDKAIWIHDISIYWIAHAKLAWPKLSTVTSHPREANSQISKPPWVSRPRLHALSSLCNPGLLGVRPGRARHDALAAQELGQADLGVDLLHALEVGLGCALGAKDEILFVAG